MVTQLPASGQIRGSVNALTEVEERLDASRRLFHTEPKRRACDVYRRSTAQNVDLPSGSILR